MSEKDEAAEVAVVVARALESIGLDYMDDGSVASSSYGEPRATRDIDFALRLQEEDIPKLVTALGPEFAVDEEMLRDAVRTRRSANIFYLPYFMKIDLFVRGGSEYDRVEFERRSNVEPVEGERVAASSPEDNLLWKLRWFRMGGEVSDQQWRDILGLLRISGARMEATYLRTWAEAHGVEDLLDRALAQSRLGE